MAHTQCERGGEIVTLSANPGVEKTRVTLSANPGVERFKTTMTKEGIERVSVLALS